jgi:hypothetical protein
MDLRKLSIGQSVVKASESPLDAIKAAMGKISYLTNGVASWIEAHSGDEKLAQENGKKVKQAEALLAEVLSNMPGAFSYHVFGLEKHELAYDNAEELITQLASKGIKHSGQSKSGGQLRKELQDQPKFDQLVGPMYGGPGKIRYETSELNDRMSR